MYLPVLKRFPANAICWAIHEEPCILLIYDQMVVGLIPHGGRGFKNNN